MKGLYYMGGCQNYGPFLGLGPYYNTAPKIQGTQKGTLILTTTHMYLFASLFEGEGFRVNPSVFFGCQAAVKPCAYMQVMNLLPLFQTPFATENIYNLGHGARETHAKPIQNLFEDLSQPQ